MLWAAGLAIASVVLSLLATRAIFVVVLLLAILTTMAVLVVVLLLAFAVLLRIGGLSTCNVMVKLAFRSLFGRAFASGGRIVMQQHQVLHVKRALRRLSSRLSV